MIKLPNELIIAQVDHYKATILSEIDWTDIVELADGDFKRFDSIGVQFILEIVTYIHAQGKQLKWSSYALKDSLTQLVIKDDIVMHISTHN